MGKKKKDPMQEAMDAALESVERIERESTADGATDEGAEEAPEAESLAEPEVLVGEDVAADEVEIDAEASEEAAAEEPAAEATPEEQIAKLNDQLLRLAADFENYRKRARRDQEELRKYGIENVVRALLPVLDNLERALAHANDADPVIQGVNMVAKQFVDALATYGVKGFASAGEAFDPERHEAMGQAPTDEVPAGAVFQEMEKGYTLHDRLLRPAKVLVAVPPAESHGAREDGDD